MDLRLIPVLLALGWLLVTLGLWGACGRPWWIWPLSVGLGLLVVGAAYGWALWRTLVTGAGVGTTGEKGTA